MQETKEIGGITQQCLTFRNLKNEKSANRNDHQNRKTEVFRNKNRKTDLKNSQNRKTENPNAPLLE